MKHTFSSLGRTIRLGAVFLLVAAGLVIGENRTITPAQASSPGCPVLVLSAMPLELDPILAHAQVNQTAAYIDHGGRGFWSGTVEGNPAIFALTGIGLVNAAATTKAAFAHFGCFSAVVFSGTSGGDYIGDVMTPSRWTTDGQHFITTPKSTLTVLKQALTAPIQLDQTTPTGDPFCTCPLPSYNGFTTPVTVEHIPQIEVGGTGLSTDGFGGRAFPCAPAASDVFGCWPCPLANTAAAQQGITLTNTLPPFLQPTFITDYSSSTTPPGTYVSQDMETASVFAVVAKHNVPFIGFRAASDGGGDPLHLPGFPAEFFLYRQLAADNAASTALAFLAAWHTAHPYTR